MTDIRRYIVAWKVLMVAAFAIFLAWIIAGGVRWITQGEVPAAEIVAGILTLTLRWAGVHMLRSVSNG